MRMAPTPACSYILAYTLILIRDPTKSQHKVFSIQIGTTTQLGSLSSPYGGKVRRSGASNPRPLREIRSGQPYSHSCQFRGIPLAPRGRSEAVVQVKHISL